jgi:predicted outer membrane protein
MKSSWITLSMVAALLIAAVIALPVAVAQDAPAETPQPPKKTATPTRKPMPSSGLR